MEKFNSPMYTELPAYSPEPNTLGGSTSYNTNMMPSYGGPNPGPYVMSPAQSPIIVMQASAPAPAPAQQQMMNVNVNTASTLGCCYEFRKCICCILIVILIIIIATTVGTFT